MAPSRSSVAKKSSPPVKRKPADPAPASRTKQAAAQVPSPAPTEPPAVVAKPKEKLVRDSFTMPRADFALIDELKARALSFKRPTKKSELLRAGLQALAALSDAALRRQLEGLAPLKAGRPKKTD